MIEKFQGLIEMLSLILVLVCPLFIVGLIMHFFGYKDE